MDAFSERFATRVRALRVADPTIADTEVGPLILPKEVDRVDEWVKEAVMAGARVSVGGNKISQYVYAPTVLIEPPENVRVSQLEVFGPVTCMYSYRELDEAIGRANNLPLAFQSSVFSQDLDIALRAAKYLDGSAILINDHTAFRADWMPFAGLHQSGYRTGGIPYTMADMTFEKLVVLKM
jgi:acyl-CoA reductase-like NAD-dependent aldehyde dehydrogenase